MTTTRISPRSIEVGPLPDEEPPPMVAGGLVFKNGMLVGGSDTAARTVLVETISEEQFKAQRRQLVDSILDAAARGDPALLFALLTWALRCTDAPSHADLAQWMEEGRERFPASHTIADISATMAHDPPPVKVRRKRTASPAMLAALERGRATQERKRLAAEGFVPIAAPIEG